MARIKDWAWNECVRLYSLGYDVADVARIVGVDVDFVKSVLDISEEE